ncbi:MAG: glycosyl transferase group 1 [Chloroflexi bacterium]|nr:glycosyl transferase group 1 [Chloroflexota bacterium]
MLVSARADRALRDEVREARRPRPEFLCLEQAHGVDLLDWSRLGAGGDRRGVRRSVRHALAAAALAARYDVVLSDGEHVGIPLALALGARRIRTPHLMIGHHLTTRAKRPILRLLGSRAGITRILLHSSRQLELAVADLGLPRERLALLPYHADASYWAPRPAVEEPLIVAAGQEHRDYTTLARACEALPVTVRVAAGSLHSPAARHRRPPRWPSNFSSGFADHPTLRDLYARASVAVVPLVETDFQAGVTTLVEAMAMGKAVVVTRTTGQRDIAVDGETALMVPPGDVPAMRRAIQRLLGSPAERTRLGAAARRAVENSFTVEAYGAALIAHCRELALPVPVRGRAHA